MQNNSLTPGGFSLPIGAVPHRAVIFQSQSVDDVVILGIAHDFDAAFRLVLASWDPPVGSGCNTPIESAWIVAEVADRFATGEVVLRTDLVVS
jgi:hypothetical protein